MDELLAAFDELQEELTRVKSLCDDRDRFGGEELATFLEELDELVPELEQLCARRWMLELLLRLCRMRERA